MGGGGGCTTVRSQRRRVRRAAVVSTGSNRLPVPPFRPRRSMSLVGHVHATGGHERVTFMHRERPRQDQGAASALKSHRRRVRRAAAGCQLDRIVSPCRHFVPGARCRSSVTSTLRVGTDVPPPWRATAPVGSFARVGGATGAAARRNRKCRASGRNVADASHASRPSRPASDGARRILCTRRRRDGSRRPLEPEVSRVRPQHARHVRHPPPSLKACTASVLCAADIKVGARGARRRAKSTYLGAASRCSCVQEH